MPSKRRTTPSRLPGSDVDYTMPRRPAADVPNCTVRVEFLAHTRERGRLRRDLERMQFAAYLVGEGKGDDGTVPTMFTRDDSPPSDAFARSWLTRSEKTDFDGKRWPLNQAWCGELLRRDVGDERRHFRIMISPEKQHGKRVDMEQFARKLMEQVDKDLRRQLVWVASAHYNTPIHHLHVAARGVDINGAEVYFPGPYAQRGFKYRARQLLGELLSEQIRPGKQALRAG